MYLLAFVGFLLLSQLIFLGSPKIRRFTSELGERVQDNVTKLLRSRRRSTANYVERQSYVQKPYLSPTEHHILSGMETALEELGLNHRIFLQVYMGDVIEFQASDPLPRSAQRFHDRILNRVIDFAVISTDGTLVLAVDFLESQDDGPEPRSGIRAGVLRAAGIPYLEVRDGDDLSNVRKLVGEVLDPDRPRAPGMIQLAS